MQTVLSEREVDMKILSIENWEPILATTSSSRLPQYKQSHA